MRAQGFEYQTVCVVLMVSSLFMDLNGHYVTY